MFQSQSDFFLPPISTKNKLYEPRFFRNSLLSRHNSESHFASLNSQQGPTLYLTEQLPQEKKKIHAKRKTNSHIYEFTYTVRNFGSIIDTQSSDKSKYHLGQKFGPRHSKPYIQHKISQHQSSILQINGASPKIGEVNAEVKPFSLMIGEQNQANKKDQDIVRVFSKKKDDRILIKKVMLVKGIGMILLFKSFEIHLDEEGKPKTRGKRGAKSIPLRKNFSELVMMLQLDHEGLQNFFQNRIEVIEGGRLKLDMEDWSFGNGLVKDWELPEFIVIEASIGSKVNRKYKVVFPCVEIYVPEHSYTQTVRLKLSELVEFLNNDAESLTKYADKFDKKKFKEEIKIRKAKVEEKPKEENNPAQVPDEPEAEVEEQHKMSIKVINSNKEFDQLIFEQKFVKDTYKEGNINYTITFLESDISNSANKKIKKDDKKLFYYISRTLQCNLLE